METWQTIIMGLLGVSFIGDIVLHFLLPSRRRKDNAESKQAEHDADKDEVARLASENGDLRALLEYEKQWRCVLTDCHDERGRQPPNEKLKGKKYNPPKRTAQDTL